MKTAMFSNKNWKEIQDNKTAKMETMLRKTMYDVAFNFDIYKLSFWMR